MLPALYGELDHQEEQDEEQSLQIPQIDRSLIANEED
jgi:hypothetical protein